MATAELHIFKANERELMNSKKDMSKWLLTVGNVNPMEFVARFYSLDLKTKYMEIALSTMLTTNCKSVEDVEKVAGALVVLSKYASNLLQPVKLRPSLWNIIDFGNTIFREKVSSVQGTQSILNKLGYTESRHGALAFPPSTEPNREVIAEIYVELVAGNLELTNYMNKCHSNPFCVEKYLPFMITKELKLVEEFRQRNENSEAASGPNEMLQDNIPLMVLEHMVSISGGEAADFLAEDKCDICGKAAATWTCQLCDNKNLCLECDTLWHQHPKRRGHRRIPFTSQASAAATNIMGDELRMANDIHLMKPNSYLNGPVFTSAVTVLRAANSTPSATSDLLTAKPSPSFSHKFGQSASALPTFTMLPAAKTLYRRDNDEDDLKAMLSKAKHPPAIYTPPTSAGTLSRQNGEFGVGSNTAFASASMYLPVSNVKYQSPATVWNDPIDAAVRPRDSVASPLCASKFSHLMVHNPTANRERLYDRSASAAGVLSGSARGTNKTAVKEDVKLYWNCEFCTFTNSYLPEGKSRICLMCSKTNNNVQVITNDVKDTDTVVKGRATSPSHLTRAASALEPQIDRNHSSNHFTSASPQFVSKFVEIQDKIYKEKKAAQYQFQRAESQRQNQTPILSSQSSGDLQNLGNHLPKLAVAANAVFTMTEAPSGNQAHRNCLEVGQPGGNAMLPAEGCTPVGAYNINRKHYNSSFVHVADQIYLEKKAAQERFQQLERENAAEFIPQPTDDVEYKEAQPKDFYGQGVDADNLSQTQPIQGIVRNTLRQEKYNDNRLSKIEQLERERQIQDMSNDGLTTVRIIKAVEASGSYTDTEIKSILSLCGGMSDPYSFYQEQWSKLIGDVVVKLQEQSIISKQSIPKELVRLSLAEARGVVEIAVSTFTNLWHQRVEIILRDCGMEDIPSNRRQVISILDVSKGDIDEAKAVIVCEKFRNHIWSEDTQMVASAEIAVDDDIYQQTTKHLNSDLSKILTNEAQSRERRTRMILAETHLAGWQRAENVLTILEEPSLVSPSSTLVDIVDAVRNRGTVEESRQFLQQQCEICFDCFPCRLIKSMGCCQCKICSTCTEQYFEVVIRERFVRNLVCPVCSLPEIDTASEQTETHFQFLLLMLRKMVSDETYELFQMKLRDWNLMMDPSFRWCASDNCKSGFLIDPDQRQNKIACPHCQSLMCQQCKKPWEDQHDGLSCEEFQSWKENNDPEVQALGLARHLEENGIECPRCKCRYSLAKGGCMHFTCIQCRHEFCSGCLQPFRRGKNCTLLRSCAKAGLHCHHPRDCLFYLRDRNITELQKLLQDNAVPYDTDPSQTRLLAGPDGQRCSVMEQKQTQNGFKDEPCGKEVPLDFAGLCEIHYKEYLVGLINKNNIDPAKIMKQEELITLINRVEKKVPKKKKGETDEHYVESLLKMVHDQLPLQRRQPEQTARENNAMNQLDAVLDHSADVTDGYHDFQTNAHHLQLDGEGLVARGVHRDSYRTLLMALGMPPNHTQMPRIKKDSGYSSLTLIPN